MLQTRQSLINRLKNHDDSDSWEEFFNIYWKLIYSYAMRSRLNDSEAQEVVQETIIAVSKQMPDFKYDRAKGSFKSWLLHLTSWRIADQYRKRRQEAAVMQPLEDPRGDTPLINRIPDPVNPNDAIWDEEWEQNLIEAALRQVKAKVKPRQYQIFDLYVLKGWPIAKVTATLGVNLGQVYMAKHRVNCLLKKEVRMLNSRY